ncbi:Uncharacterised protein [Mycobacterium tuberculosis]|uniref:Uncharacterized protein n=1 Tax=Mycobacterium tuberculosis TaxID=1773 RepID=A0A655E5E3_MYCTX|nr:Uncharacterised protein [Mycobacterium tuberculosis]CNV05365.1 Uncharacterised protein [Mycobacterium tuberculosis]
MLKIPSVTIAPPISAPRSAPRKVTTGISELRRMCTVTTRGRDNPLAVAVRT